MLSHLASIFADLGSDLGPSQGHLGPGLDRLERSCSRLDIVSAPSRLGVLMPMLNVILSHVEHVMRSSKRMRSAKPPPSPTTTDWRFQPTSNGGGSNHSPPLLGGGRGGRPTLNPKRRIVGGLGGTMMNAANPPLLLRKGGLGCFCK